MYSAKFFSGQAPDLKHNRLPYALFPASLNIICIHRHKLELMVCLDYVIEINISVKLPSNGSHGENDFGRFSEVAATGRYFCIKKFDREDWMVPLLGGAVLEGLPVCIGSLKSRLKK